MGIGSYYYKMKARAALKGNWQTAMVIAFFSGIMLTVCETFVSVAMPGLYYIGVDGLPVVNIGTVTRGAATVLSVLELLSFLVTPALSVSCNHYFVKRLQGEDLGVAGLWCRMSAFGKALWLYVLMGVRILLWTLLFVVPGILAALRYSMAPYYLAENPDMSAKEALEASKARMANLKLPYFTLLLSFVGWALLSNLMQIFLMSFSTILSIVAGLFIQVWLGAYVNGAVASFFLTVNSESASEEARQDLESRLGGGKPWDKE